MCIVNHLESVHNVMFNCEWLNFASAMNWLNVG